ncbi:hypothetical protein MBLNU13_g07029t2 [Cladosporium sp. NU13]
MASLDGSGTPRAQTTTGTDMPSANDTLSSTHTPSIPAIINTPSTTDKPLMPDKPSSTDSVFTTITPLTDGIILGDDKQSPTETPSPRFHRAAHAVLSINELLCNIIAHLPLEDIAAATGICRSWHKVIAADTTLQQAMFLKPVELSHVLVGSRKILALGESETISIDKCNVVGRLNPFAKKVVGVGPLKEPPALFGGLHLNGIWRDMFITQPPCIRVHMEIYQLRLEVDEGFDLEWGDGVKLGNLYDYIYYNLFEGTLSVRTTVRKYVTETTNLPDRTPCIVRNGSWENRDGEQCLFEKYYERYRTSASDDPFEDYIPGDSSYDSEQEGDGRLDDQDGHVGDAYDDEHEDDDESRRIPLQMPRVNVYMPSRQYTVWQNSSEEDVDWSDAS